jgi:hypothetical protein
MCTCIQKSRTPLAPGKGFHYKFDCTDSDGKVKKIELDASNDNIAKQLAELECSEGIRTLSFAETEKIMSSIGIKSLDLNQSETNDKSASLLADNIVLNPTTWTRLAQYGSGVRGCTIRMSGRWIPGIGHPAWDANGQGGNIFNGANKWCVLIQIHAGTDVVATIPWTAAQGGVMSVGNFGFPTAVIAFMNDDKYDDNTHEAGNPMTANVSLF